MKREIIECAGMCHGIFFKNKTKLTQNANTRCVVKATDTERVFLYRNETNKKTY